MRVLLLCWEPLPHPQLAEIRGLRRVARWLVEAGHEVTALCGSDFGAIPGAVLSEELRRLGAPAAGRHLPGSLAMIQLSWAGVQLHMLVNRWGATESADERVLSSHALRLVRDVRPQLCLALGPDPRIVNALRLVRQGGARVVQLAWSKRTAGPDAFQHAHAVLVGSAELSAHYLSLAGARSTFFPPPAGDCHTSGAARSGILAFGGRSAEPEFYEFLHNAGYGWTFAGIDGVASDGVAFVPRYDSVNEVLARHVGVLVPSGDSVVRAEAVVNGTIPLEGEDPHTALAALRDLGIAEALARESATLHDPARQASGYLRFFEAVARG